MIVEYLRYTIPDGQQADFIRDYTAAIAPLMRSPFADNIEICQCVEDETQFTLRIEWTSAEDHLQGFRNSAEFREFFGHIRKYVSSIDEMRHYRRVAQA